MKSQIKKLFQIRILQYFLGDIFFKGSKFILIASLTYILDKSSVGFYTLFESTVVLSKSFFSLGLSNFIQTKKYELNNSEFKKIIRAITTFKLVSGFFLGLIMILIILYLDIIFFAIDNTSLVYAVFSGLSLSLFQVFLEKDVVEGNSKKYVIQKNTFNTALVFSILLCSIIFNSVQAIIQVYTFCHLGLLLFTLIVRSKHRFNLIFKDAKLIYDLLFNKTLIYFFPYNILLWGISFSDRFIIERELDLNSVAIYSTAVAFASIISVLAVSLKNTMIPKIYTGNQTAEFENPKKIIYLISGTLIIFANDIYYYFLPESYYLGHKVFTIILIALIMFLNATVQEVVLFHNKKIKHIIYSQSALLFLNISGSLFAARNYGIEMVAFISLLTFFSQFILYVLFSSKRPLKRLVSEISLIAGLVLIFLVFFLFEIPTSLKPLLFLLLYSSLFFFVKNRTAHSQ